MATFADHCRTVTIREEPTKVAVVAPETSDPAMLIRHLEAHEPVKVALARDLPLVIRKIEKTARGIKAMMEEEEGQETLHKGLGWLHYRPFLFLSTMIYHFYEYAAYITRDSCDICYDAGILPPPRRLATIDPARFGQSPHHSPTVRAEKGCVRLGGTRLRSRVRRR